MDAFLTKLISHLERYDVFTTIMPGFLFLTVCSCFGINHIPNGLFEKIGLIFFFGLLSSRVGVLIVEMVGWIAKKILRSTLFLPYKEYRLLLRKEKDHTKMLIGNANWYRSLIGMTILLMFEQVAHWQQLTWQSVITIIGMLIIFLYSYGRQVFFIYESYRMVQGEELVDETSRI